MTIPVSRHETVMIRNTVRPAPARRRPDVDPRRGADDRDRCGVPRRQRQPALLRVDDRGDQLTPTTAGCMPSWCRIARFSTMRRRRRTGRSCRGAARRRRSRWTRVSRSTARSAPACASTSRRRREAHAAGRGQRRLLGHSRQAEHPLSRVVLREGGARIRRPGRRSRSRATTGGRSTPGTVAGLTGRGSRIRTDAPDRQRRAHDGGALRADRGSARHGLVQPGLAVPADLQESAERLPARHHADAGRHEAEVPAVPGRQLPRGRSDRRSVRVEEDARAALGASRPHGAVGLSLVRRPGPARVPAVVRGHGRRAGARRLCRLLAQGRARESGTGPRARTCRTRSTRSST